jgi:hypothetical protein
MLIGNIPAAITPNDPTARKMCIGNNLFTGMVDELRINPVMKNINVDGIAVPLKCPEKLIKSNRIRLSSR